MDSDFYKKEFFNFNSYITKPRWNSYYHQVIEAIKLGNTCLVIGVGDSIVPAILKQIGVTVYTFDYSKDLQPDFHGSVADILDILPQGFKVDVILCCQVMEHLEYQYFESTLEQFQSIATKGVVISLPCWHVSGAMSLKISMIPKMNFAIAIPRFWSKFKQGGEHYWEIGARHYPLRRISDSIKKYFDIVSTYRVFELQYHRFFVCTKTVKKG